VWGDPVGYVFQADIHCPDCIRVAFGPECVSAEAALEAAPWTVASTRREHGLFASLAVWMLPPLAPHLPRRATRVITRLFDRYDEDTFDSGDFPKVYVGTPHDGCHPDNGYGPGQCGDRCGWCGQPIDGACPNVAEVSRC
jgi:hypothetical protein